MALDQEQQSLSSAAAKEERKKRRKRRWGAASEAPPVDAAAAGDGAAAAGSSAGDNVTAPPPPSTASTTGAVDAKEKALALQDSIRAKLAALKANKKVAVPPGAAKTTKTTTTSTTTTTTTTKASLKRPAETTVDPTKGSKKAKHFDIDFTVTGPTFQKEKDELAATLKPKKKVNPYLIADAIEDDKEDAEIDERLVRASKHRSRHRAITFVEPGTFVQIAERKRQKAVNAAESGFTSGRKTGQYKVQSNMAQVYGAGGTGGAAAEETSYTDPTRLPERAEHRYAHMPLVMEWWDTELLPPKLKKVVARHEGQALSQQAQAQLHQLGTVATSSNVEGEDADGGKKMPAKATETELEALRTTCFEQASLSYSKTAALIQHIVPMKPPYVAENEKPVRPVIHLTKKK